MVKRSMQQKEIMILNIYVPNTGAPIYIKQVLNNLQRDRVEDFNTPQSILDRSMRQDINKDIQDLNSDLEQANLITQTSPPQIHRVYILLSTTSHLI